MGAHETNPSRSDSPQTLVSSYEQKGFVFPISVLSPEEAAEQRQALEAAEEMVSAPDVRKLLFGFANIVLPSVDELMRQPSITDPVSEVLGDDLLVLGASFFVKEPISPAFVSWHQDLTYWGLNDDAEVTAWIALTPATVETGCMRFLPKSHRDDVVPHRDTFSDDNMLSRGQEVDFEIREEEAVDVILAPGEMSLHHGHLFHASNPNRSNDRRIGLALRFVSPSMCQTGGQRTFAHLVAGEDRYGNFELMPRPSGVLASDDLARAKASLAMQTTVRL
jgi:non-heme Fe2+,alpha-ketoglutarate-dependent halogenase